ncbi:MAG: SDR family NAD(P)-dependent oxidoreductase [Bradymonadia bacterium]
MAERFKDKVVIITGASAGIGEAAAHLFAEEGARVVVSARGRERLEQVAEELRAKGAEVFVQPGDVGDDGACKALIDETVAHFGGVDVLVNNAGLHHRGLFEEVEAEDLAHMVHVNLRAPVLLTRLVLPHLRQRGGGAVVQVASLAGRAPVPGSAVYSATKFGLRAFSRALAEELRGTGIHMTIVSPGPVDTGFIMDDIDAVSDLTFSQPISTSEEVAAAILDCAADGKMERALPGRSGVLTTAAYLAPGLGRALRPMLERKGRKTKDRLRKAGRKA